MNEQDVTTFIRELLGKLQIQIDSIERVETRMHPMYVIHTSESALLIGTHGETLRALNTLVQKCLEPKEHTDTHQFSIDVNNYKLKHIQTVEESARLAAERVRTFKHDVEMEPMSSYDRLIVHSLLADDPTIVTESLGEGETRRVVLKLRTTA